MVLPSVDGAGSASGSVPGPGNFFHCQSWSTWSRFLDESEGDRGEGDETVEVEEEDEAEAGMELELFGSWKLVRTGVLVIQGVSKDKGLIALAIDDASTHLVS